MRIKHDKSQTIATLSRGETLAYEVTEKQKSIWVSRLQMLAKYKSKRINVAKMSIPVTDLLRAR